MDEKIKRIKELNGWKMKIDEQKKGWRKLVHNQK